MQRFVLSFLIVLASISSYAQSFSVSGLIRDEINEPLAGAGVALLSKKDSAVITGDAADESGKFILNVNKGGAYILKISFLGYADYYKAIVLKDTETALGNIQLKQTAKKLKDVEVIAQATAATQKEDTSEYNAKSFKTNPDANAEDLIQKMPGVVNNNGKIQTQGEDVKQVLVDGKPFFGDDPNAVLKNLPAEVIDKIQVFDRKSDQSQLTGFDDGNTSKTINIITKQEFRNGLFGKVYGGYGYADKYKAGLVLNYFKDKKRLTFLYQSNNINEQNFSADDLAGVLSSGANGASQRGGGRFMGGAGGGPRGGGGNDAGQFLVDQRNGITTTHSAGLNYADTWKGKVDFAGSYFFNWSNNESGSTTQRQYISSGLSGVNYNERSNAESRNINHRLNLRFDIKIDSANQITLTTRGSTQQNKGLSNLYGENATTEGLLSNTSNDFKSKLFGFNLNQGLMYVHRFEKRGRSFSVNMYGGYNNQSGNSNLLAATNYYADSLTFDSLDQQSQLDKYGLNVTTGIMYTEPIDSNHSLMFSYNNSYNLNNSDKETYLFSSGENDYTVLDTALSNLIRTQYISNSGGVTYRYQKSKITISIGASLQYAELWNETRFPNNTTTRKGFLSGLPNAMLMYRPDNKKNLRIYYRSSNNFPTADQLQPAINNTNPLSLNSGNPDLKQDYQHFLNMRYSSVNTAKSTSFFVLLGGGYTQNYIGNSLIVAENDTTLNGDVLLSAGSQYSKPVNLQGYFNLRSFLNYSIPIKKIKTNFNLNASATFSRTPSLINNQTNFANTPVFGLGVAFTSNISEKVDFNVSTNSSFTLINNTLRKQSNQQYLNQTTRAKIQVNPWKGLVFAADVSHQYYYGLSSSINSNVVSLNAAVAYKFLKNKAAEFRFTAYDILNQNTSIQRNVTETYIEDVQTNVLQRYFMLTFTYNFKWYPNAGKPKESKP
jgi:hypothetical protein